MFYFSFLTGLLFDARNYFSTLDLQIHPFLLSSQRFFY
jgi:hypothetical protein